MTSPHHEFPDRIPAEFHPRLRRLARDTRRAAEHTPLQDLVRNHFDQFLCSMAERVSMTSDEFAKFADEIADVCEHGMQLARRHDLAQRGHIAEEQPPRALPALTEVRGGK